MSKVYKKKKEIIDNEDAKEDISKKELYEMRKKEKEKLKSKNKVNKKVKKAKKTSHQTSLAGRIFAIIMLILMIGSTIATISYYFRY